MVLIRRRDKTPLTKEDYQFALAAANAACDRNPEWTQAIAMGELSDYDPSRPGFLSAKGAAFLTDGSWSFHEICE